MADAEEYHPLLYVTASIGIAGPSPNNARKWWRFG
jgi:hypothetical protein